MNKSFLLLVVVCILLLENSKGYGQHMPPYSLQPALESLHRRDAIAGHVPSQSQIDYNDEDVNEPNPSRNSKIDRLIAAYLAKDYLEDDDSEDGNYFLPEEKKKSYFRERDEKVDPPPYPSPVMSVFRERDVQPYTQTELADEFLREIEEEREMEREEKYEKYKDALRNLWEKYQDQENEIITEPEEKRPQFMQKKRTYPVLPWLPYTDKRKRFPVAKRSPKVDKQSKDLEEIFGKPSDDEDKKKKRSVDSQGTGSATSSTTEVMPADGNHNHTEHGHGHNHTEHKHHKHEDEEESSESEEQDHEHDEYEEDSEEEYDPFSSNEEDDENRKKKRDTSKLKICQGHLCKKNNKGLGKSRQKKSIDWSQYFGLNRKKKSLSAPEEEELSPEKIEKMDRKLQFLEDEVLAETVKITGAYPEAQSLAEIRRMKENVMSNLATAYTLEKMRQALNNRRQSIENENHLGRNQIESFEEKAKRLSVKKEKVDFDKHTHDIDIEQDKMKEHVHGGNNMGGVNDSDDDEEEKKRKKRKRTRYEKYPILPNDIGNFPDELEGLNYEPLNDAYLGNKNFYQNSYGECAIAENIDEKCKNIAVLSGAVNSELLTLCNVHQLCHLCSTTQVGCDFEYINEADRVCGRNANCLSSVRANMRMLRDSAGPQIGLKECMKIPCLNRLLKDINKR